MGKSAKRGHAKDGKNKVWYVQVLVETRRIEPDPNHEDPPGTGMNRGMCFNNLYFVGTKREDFLQIKLQQELTFCNGGFIHGFKKYFLPTDKRAGIFRKYSPVLTGTVIRTRIKRGEPLFL
ncbi:MAG: hypothetical protein KBD29_03995 [Candidatus Magasanikbacteria bacterium]|nr:hypothetical protein [Candidatus Magasanikbacteria bacterium]